MIRYLKLSFEGPEGDYNSYCTLTNLKVYGNSMNYVMRNALHELSSPEAPNPDYYEPKPRPIQISYDINADNELDP